MAASDKEIIQMRAHLPARSIERLKKLAEKRGLSLSALLGELLANGHQVKHIALPASRKDWQTVTLRVPHGLRLTLQKKSGESKYAFANLVSAILLSSLAEL